MKRAVFILFLFFPAVVFGVTTDWTSESDVSTSFTKELKNGRFGGEGVLFGDGYGFYSFGDEPTRESDVSTDWTKE